MYWLPVHEQDVNRAQIRFRREAGDCAQMRAVAERLFDLRMVGVATPLYEQCFPISGFDGECVSEARHAHVCREQANQSLMIKTPASNASSQPFRLGDLSKGLAWLHIQSKLGYRSVEQFAGPLATGTL